MQSLIKTLCSLLYLFLITTMAYAADTNLKFYRPSEQIKNIQVMQGECFAQSNVIKREDAWQCRSAGRVMDPCFINVAADGSKAFCLNTPWDNHSTQLQLSHPVVNDHFIPLDMSKAIPWAVEIGPEIRCAVARKIEKIDGLAVHYQCSNGSVLVGHLQRCNPEWTMLQSTNQALQPAVITQAWF